MTLKAITVLAALLALAATPAAAAFKVDIGGTIITDNGAGDLNPFAGFIQYFDAGTDLNFSFNTGTSTSANPFGTITISNTGQGSGTYPANLVIRLTDTDFMLPPGPDGSFLLLGLTSNNPSGAVGTVTSVGYYDPTNTEFNTGPGTTATGTATVDTVVDTDDSETSPGIVPFVTPFSLTQVVTISLTGPGTSVGTPNNFQLEGNLTVVAVPEPQSVLLFGTLMLGCAGILRKKFAR